jgi:hypothetical protein
MMKSERDPLDLSAQAETVVGAGRGGLIMAMFGAGLLGWGLGVAKAFNAAIGPALGFTALFLWAWSIYTIRKGRHLRRQFPPVPASTRRAIRSSFLLVTLIDAVALGTGTLLWLASAWALLRARKIARAHFS